MRRLHLSGRRQSCVSGWRSLDAETMSGAWRKRRRLQRCRKASNLSQLRAGFMVDADPTIIYAHYSERPSDRPDIAEVVDAVVIQDR